VYRLKNNEVKVVSINLADELVIMLIFVNNEHFANTVMVDKVSHADKMRMLIRCMGRIRSNLAKAIIRVYKNEFNGGHFEHLM